MKFITQTDTKENVVSARAPRLLNLAQTLFKCENNSSFS